MLQSHPVIYKAIKHYYIFLRSFTSDNYSIDTQPDISQVCQFKFQLYR